MTELHILDIHRNNHYIQIGQGAPCRTRYHRLCDIVHIHRFTVDGIQLCRVHNHQHSAPHLLSYICFTLCSDNRLKLIWETISGESSHVSS